MHNQPNYEPFSLVSRRRIIQAATGSLAALVLSPSLALAEKLRLEEISPAGLGIEKVGLYTVTYAREEAPLDVQEAAFAAKGLEIVSPAQLGFLRTKGRKGTFNLYSRTNADVFYDDRTNQVVIVPDGAISKIVGVSSLVGAHRQDREYIIPKNQRDTVYATVDEMLKNSIAFTANHGTTNVQTSEFGKNDLTSRLFSDKRLGFEAQEYGDWLKKQGRASQLMFFDIADYAKSQKGPYLNRLRVFGPVSEFDVIGYRDLGNDGGAFGVHFEKIVEGGPKNPQQNK